MAEERVTREKVVKLSVPHEKARFNEIYIRGGRPLEVYIKHARKVLTKHETLVLHAMTAAIEKGVKLHVRLMEEYPYLKANIITDSVPTIANYDGELQVK
jgi:precorrin-6B methylase 2